MGTSELLGSGSSITTVADPDDGSLALDVMASLPTIMRPERGPRVTTPGAHNVVASAMAPLLSFGAHHNRLHRKPHRRSPQSLDETHGCVRCGYVRASRRGRATSVFEEDAAGVTLTRRRRAASGESDQRGGPNVHRRRNPGPSVSVWPRRSKTGGADRRTCGPVPDLVNTLRVAGLFDVKVPAAVGGLDARTTRTPLRMHATCESSSLATGR